MNKSRLEAFSDGVIAILITIMVLELKVPAGGDFESLRPVLPTIVAYALSFIYLGIYWTNHHHMLQTVTQINGKILWANLHLLFWLSLIPFMTAWVGQSHFVSFPTAVYGGALLMSGMAYSILKNFIIAFQGKGSKLAAAVGKDFKGNLSLVLYTVAIPLAFFNPWISDGLYILVAMMWLVPDRRIEKRFKD